jgi:hypothetical protein
MTSPARGFDCVHRYILLLAHVCICHVTSSSFGFSAGAVGEGWLLLEVHLSEGSALFPFAKCSIYETVVQVKEGSAQKQRPNRATQLLRSPR